MKTDIVELTVLKRAKADYLDILRQGHASGHTGRNGYESKAVLGYKQAVLGLVVGIVFRHRVGGKLRKSGEGEFAYIGHVCGNMQAFKAGPIEGIGHDHQVLTVSKGNALQLLDLAERVMVDFRDAIGNR